MKKRLFSILLALTLCLTMLPATALAEDSGNVAKIGETEYATLAEAIAAVPENGSEPTTITLLRDVTDAVGITVDGNKSFTVDFDNHTYTVKEPGAGSEGTETNAFQLIKGNTVTFKNGTIQVAEENLERKPNTSANDGSDWNIKMIIMNYSNLTLENMTLDGTNLYQAYYGSGENRAPGANYTLSNVCGTVSIKDSTIKAKTGNNVDYTGTHYAFDVDYRSGYSDGTQVTVENSTIVGDIEVTTAAKSSLTVKSGSFTDIAAAVKYAKDGASIKLADDADCAGIVFPEATFTTSGLTIDLNGKTLTLKDPMVGSAGTETNGFQILKGNKVTIQNGTIQSSAAKYLIQNYSDLTLDGVKLDGSDLEKNAANYTLSNNCGTVKIKNSTIIAKSGQYAFDVYGGFGSYSDVSVEVENSTINGNIEVARANTTNNNNNSLYFKSGELNGEIVKRASCTDNTTIAVTGGYFTADPSAYVADGSYVHPSDKSGYTYMVNDTAPETDDTPIFVEEKNEVTVNAGTDSKLTDADVNNIQNNTSVSGTDLALKKDEFVEANKGDSNIDSADKVTVEVKVTVELTKEDLTDEKEGTLTFTATPTATIYVGDSSTAAATDVAVSNSMLNGEAITVTLPLPAGFVPRQIKHVSRGYATEYFLNKALVGSKRGAKTFEVVDGCAVFQITHFSTFEVSGDVTYTEPPIVTSKPAHDVDVKKAANGSVTVNQDEARQGSIVTITAAPDAGYTLESLTVLDKNGNALTLNSLGGNKFSFIMPDGDVTVRASFTNGSAAAFVDVPAGKYFTEPVAWAVASGITGGTDATHFSPYASCTRGQLVTFLWRAAGEPAAEGAKGFSDVKTTSSFYKAILWAAENGIVGGYADGTFHPNAAVTRQQVAAILYRYAQYAKMDVSVGEDTNILSFNDAFEVSEYAIAAFQWAVGEGVITGNEGNLLPHDTCTRAQIVTMLYRLLAD